MKIGTLGLWHLGFTYATCLAEIGHTVIGIDTNTEHVAKLTSGTLPIWEPNLTELLQKNMKEGKLKFTTNLDFINEVEVLIISFDYPIEFTEPFEKSEVFSALLNVAQIVKDQIGIVIATQVPLGSYHLIKRMFRERNKNNALFMHPENLRLGRALETFMAAERILIGSEDGRPDTALERVFSPLGCPISWVSNESAEMVKHALNCFLAMSITFMGEIADICSTVGADATEVEFGLRSDSRIGLASYIKPGLGFSGGTLARDVATLASLPNQRSKGRIIANISESNDYNNGWLKRVIVARMPMGKMRILFCGVTYTQGTSTLRGSTILELMFFFKTGGAFVEYMEEVDITNQISNDFQTYDFLQDTSNRIDFIVISKDFSWYANSKMLDEILSKCNWIIDPTRILLKYSNELILRSNYLAVGLSKSG